MSYFTEIKVVDPTTNEAVTVNDEGQMHVVLRGAVDDSNSSSTALDAGATFTGESTDILDYGIIFVSIYSDVASATDGLEIQQSCDGTNWDISDKFTIPAGTGKIFSIQPGCKYLRVLYTNGGSDQTDFRLSTVLKKTNSRPSTHRLKDDINDDDDAELQIAIIKGQNPAGTYVDFDATTAGNFKVSLEELENGISVNSNSQLMVTPFDSSGTEHPSGASANPEHNKVVGVEYIAGNSGVDASTETLQNLDYAHHEVHEGNHYFISGYELAAALNDTVEFTVQVPDSTTWPHMIFELFSSTGATFEMYEGATGVSGGSSVTPLNNNRNSANTSELTILKNPTVTDSGSLIVDKLVGGERQSGSASRENEIILKQNTTYHIVITSLANSNDISWVVDWYEHADKN